MAEPKKDTVRIALPSRTPATPIRRLPPAITPLPSAEPAAEAPSALPRRPPFTPPVSPASSPLLQPLPKTAHDESVTAAPSVSSGPKNDTARISFLPRPAPEVMTSRPVPPVDAIPRSLAWGLLGVSAVIFLIQIWNYVVS
jgi:hypothetical protein